MNTINDYKILRRENPCTLEGAVRSKIKAGWQPLGGVAISATAEGAILYLQAMARRVTDD